MAIDITGEVKAALLDPEVVRALAAELAPLLRDALAKHEPLLTSGEAAAHVGMTPVTFRSTWLHDPDLAAISIGSGRSRRFKRADLERWAAGRKPRRKRGT
jgi:hypothetical protein